MSNLQRMPLPSQDAAPEAVRRYFVHILQDKYNVYPEAAESLASQWQYGRGYELTYYDGNIFHSIFGGEVGSILYHHVRRASGLPTAPSDSPSKAELNKTRKDIFGITPGISVIYLLLFLGLFSGYQTWVLVRHDNTDTLAFQTLLTTSSLSLALFLVTYFLYYFG